MQAELEPTGCVWVLSGIQNWLQHFGWASRSLTVREGKAVVKSGLSSQTPRLVASASHEVRAPRRSSLTPSSVQRAGRRLISEGGTGHTGH